MGMNKQFKCKKSCDLHKHKVRVGDPIKANDVFPDSSHDAGKTGVVTKTGWQAAQAILDITFDDGNKACVFEQHVTPIVLSEEEVNAALSSIQEAFTRKET